MNMVIQDVFEEWKEGTISPERALAALANDYGEVESQLDPLTKERDQIRDRMSYIVASTGQRYTLPGFGVIRMTDAAKTASYDTKALDDLVRWLLDSDQTDIARRIQACRKESGRAGSLRIERERGKR